MKLRKELWFGLFIDGGDPHPGDRAHALEQPHQMGIWAL